MLVVLLWGEVTGRGIEVRIFSLVILIVIIRGFRDFSRGGV